MHSDLLETLLVFCYSLMAQEKFAKACAVLAALVSVAPQNVFVLRQYATVLQRLNRNEESLIYTEKLLQLEMSSPEKRMAAFLHASALWELGRESEASITLKEHKGADFSATNTAVEHKKGE